MRFVVILLAAVLVRAEPLKLPEPYQSIVELARATPPEFAADAMLRVVESGKISDRDARHTLIEESFHLAAGAKFPFRMRGLPGTTVDTRSGFQAQAYGLAMDALSLESRAVKDMSALDPAAALRLFLEIPPPEPAPLTCDDALVYDPSTYYEALGEVVNRGFKPEARAKEEHINLLLTALSQATSPFQLAPLARVIHSANVTPAQRDVLWIKFGAILENMQPDSRSYSASLSELGGEAASGAPAAFEKFRQRGAGCSGDTSPGVTLELSGGGTVKTGSTPVLHPFWQSGAAKQLLEDGKKLRFTGSRALSESDRSTPEWRQQLSDYLGELAAWTPSPDESEADYFHERSLVYQSLIEVIPPGQERDSAIGAFLDFVTGSSLQQQSPVEWFLEVKVLIERARSSGGEPGKILDGIERSGNPALRLSMALDQALGASIPAWARSQTN